MNGVKIRVELEFRAGAEVGIESDSGMSSYWVSAWRNNQSRIEFKPEARCRALSLLIRDPGVGHKAQSTYRGAWVSCRAPYSCWSRWALGRK